MRNGSAWAYFLGCLVATSVALSPGLSRAGERADDEKRIYLSAPLVTEYPWTQTGVYLKNFMFEIPNVVSRPNAQVGFVFMPGLTWSALDLIEVNVGFPMVINKDGTGDRELNKAKLDPTLADAANWDKHPDFDAPGLQVGIKANITGKKPEDQFFFAVGATSSLPIGEKYGINFMPPKNNPNHSSGVRINPYVSLAYAMPRFTPQLQLGTAIRPQDEIYDPRTHGTSTKGYFDFFFNLALPYALPVEGTVPMLELNGAFGQDGSQLFLTPAVTFLPKKSFFQLGFACMIPIADAKWRDREGFRVLFNFSYALDGLGIPAPDEEPAAATGGQESPPSGW
jgi:hypothetical protein